MAVGQSLRPAASIQAVIDGCRFVQADPIRAPARAQDLMLRHRVEGYTTGDLERCYADLAVEEAFFINYGFVTPALFALMHPRGHLGEWPASRRRRAEHLLAFVLERGEVHPRDVTDHFGHGRVTNYWGGSSSATTHMLDQLHYLGLVRVARRESGVRVYGARREVDVREGRLSPSEIDARLDTLVDVLVENYAPLPWRSLAPLIRRLRYAAPQWRPRLPQAVARARARLVRGQVDGVDWYWPSTMTTPPEVGDEVRLLAPFDPVVWDRVRFEQLWGWEYRFEAYTPESKRQRGYYALPLLWRDRVIGWANVSVTNGVMTAECGYVAGRRPRERGFNAALESELARMRAFLGASVAGRPSVRGQRR